jgi:protein-S-isoprenylcysteine O-methyltransferase Ste14
MIHPLWCILGVSISFIFSFAWFHLQPESFERLFFLPLLVLILFYTLYAIFTDREKYSHRTLGQIVPAALRKYIFWGALIGALGWFYEIHPFYHNAFPKTLFFIQSYYKLFLGGGFFYFLLIEKYRHSTQNVLQDPSLRFVSLAKLSLKGRFHQAGRRLCRGKFRHFFISSLLRLHYMPLMVEGLYSYGKRILDESDLSNTTCLIAFLTAVVWAIDHNNAAMGYFWESDFTKTKFRQVDPYPIHYLITLSCYFPFNNFVNTFIKSPMETGKTDFLLDSPLFQTGTEIAILLFVACYALTGTTLAFSWSNLCYKQIQTRGFYAYVRHPGTFFKLGFFLLMIFRFKSSFTAGTILAYAAWTGIYLLRTLCEERFLKRFSEYREYMKQTPYRVIPGVF